MTDTIEAAPVAAPVVTPEPQPTVTPAVTPAAPPAAPPVQQQGTQIQDVSVLQQLLTEARAEAADRRTKQRAAEEAKQAAEKALAAERLERQLEKVAAKASVDADLLLPYLRGTGQLDKLDTADPDKLHAALVTLVEATVKERPALKLGVAPPSSGPPPTGGGEARNFTRRQIEQMTPAERLANLDAIQEWQKRGSPGIDG